MTPATVDELKQVLDDAFTKAELIRMLADIAEHMSYDSLGGYNPEESHAAKSAADFVDRVGETFANNGINI